MSAVLTPSSARTQPVRKAQDLAQAAEMLAQAAEREGYRVIAVHPLFQYAGEDYSGPRAVTLELDVPKLDKAFLPIRPEVGLYLPLRATLFERGGVLFVSMLEVSVYRDLLGDLPPEPARLLDWMEVTQDILFRALTG